MFSTSTQHARTHSPLPSAEGPRGRRGQRGGGGAWAGSVRFTGLYSTINENKTKNVILFSLKHIHISVIYKVSIKAGHR